MQSPWAEAQYSRSTDNYDSVAACVFFFFPSVNINFSVRYLSLLYCRYKTSTMQGCHLQTSNTLFTFTSFSVISFLYLYLYIIFIYFLFLITFFFFFTTVLASTCLSTKLAQTRTGLRQTLQGVWVAVGCSTRCNAMLHLWQVFTHCSRMTYLCTWRLGVTYSVSFELTHWFCIVFVLLAAWLSGFMCSQRDSMCRWDAVALPNNPAEHMSETLL